MAGILDTVKNVLSSPAARRIDFHLGTINVDAAGLATIHNLVAVGTIPVKVEAMRSGVAAQYRNSTNSLMFPRESFGANAQERCDILHECIHALHDMYGGGSYYPQRGGSRFTPRSENEAAAYVADALFYRYETGGVQPGGSIIQIAAQIAGRIANKRGAFVTTAEARALRVAVVLDPTYKYGYESLTAADGP
ncbi:MAG: hypothetical protein AB7O88_08985 [Reyranellaceae bacterium]